MHLKRSAAFAVLVAVSAVSGAGRAETPEQWIELGARVHGGFGAFIPAGIRIGLDALERLKSERRGVTVTFYSGEKAPCPCIADGVMLATQASPGQGTLQVAADKAPTGLLAVVVIRDRKTGAGLRYSVADTWMPKIVDWNRTLDPAGRYQAAMSAPGLFETSARVAHAARAPAAATQSRHQPYPPGGERFFGNHRLTAPLVRQRTE